MMADLYGSGMKPLWVSLDKSRRVVIKHQPYIKVPKESGGLLFVGVFDFVAAGSKQQEDDEEEVEIPCLAEELGTTDCVSDGILGACSRAEDALMRFAVFDADVWPRPQWLGMKSTKEADG